MLYGKRGEVKYKIIISIIITITLYSFAAAQNLEVIVPDYKVNALTQAIIDLHPKIDLVIANKIAYCVMSECIKKNLEPALITALIYTESTFNPLSESKKGACGLMQVRYSTWKGTDIFIQNNITSRDQLFWIEANIKCGTDIFLRYYKRAKGDISKALYRYNTGKGLPKKTKPTKIRYINKVVYTAYIILSKIGG